MSFQQALSGLNASAKSLDVIGNNIANASTVGFKASQTQFADVFASSLSGGGGGQVGIGTRLAGISQQFTQGNVTTTNNALDVAVNGRGFFRLSNNGEISYSRNGQFQLDKDGYLVNNTGLNVTGYQVDANGNLTGALDNLRLSQADIAPKLTGTASVSANLNANATPPTAAWVPPNPGASPPVALDMNSFNSSTSMTVFDSLGNSHIMGLYFAKTAANTWDVYTTVDGYGTAAAVTNVPALTGLPFTTAGVVDSAAYTPPTAMSLNLNIPNPSGGAATPLAISFDFSNMTQYGAEFSVSELAQDGYTSGRLAGFNVGSDGVIKGRYSNGQTKNLGQIALANFINPQGLAAVGDNQWVESANSGQPLVGSPGSGTLGVLQASSVEDSNVDMTQELVAMIIQQRAYQANAQTIKTQDQVLQTLVNLR